MKRRVGRTGTRERLAGLSRATLAGCLASLLLNGCGSNDDSASDSSASDGSETAVLVDDDGVIEDFEFSFNVEEHDNPADDAVESIEPPDGWDVRIIWTGLHCHTAPTVRVAAADGRSIEVQVTVGPIVSADGDCESAEVVHSLTMTTSFGAPQDVRVSLER